MAVVRCENSHFYDDNRHSSCPHCVATSASPDDAKTVSGANIESRALSQRLVDFGAVSPGDEKTIGIYMKKHGQDPVTGWLVCVKGPEKGRDFRLHSGRNFLGRAPNMDISVAGDEQISRENHCTLVYEPKTQAFFLMPDSANTYLNGENITEAALLKDSDIIKAGASEFMFVPFCRKGREW